MTIPVLFHWNQRRDKKKNMYFKRDQFKLRFLNSESSVSILPKIQEILENWGSVKEIFGKLNNSRNSLQFKNRENIYVNM